MEISQRGKEEIPQIARKHLDKFIDQPGDILYSGYETLKPGDVYLLGFNPGGEGGEPILKSIENMLRNQKNEYMDECWKNRSGSWPAGKAPLQERICWLLKSLGLNPREVCASNLIFFRSREAKNIDNLASKSWQDWANDCWPVHEAIINLVKPKLLIVFGNSNISSYGYLHDKFGGQEDRLKAGHGNWIAKGFNAHINGQDIYVAGLPHLSRYSPIGKSHIVDWLSSKVHGFMNM